jgi:glycosyltransferase involved in cell wall biosynthesis
MTACYVFQDEYPWDVRAEKILTSLASHGIAAHVVARNRLGGRTHEELSPGIQVHRLPALRNQWARDLVNFPAFFSPFWIATILRVVRRTKAKVIIVRDLPLSPAALLVGWITGLPVLMDMAENYPAMIQDTWTHRGRSGLDVILRNPSALKRLERFVLSRLDGVLVVSGHSGSRVHALGVPENRIWVVSNTPRTGGASGADGSDHSSNGERGELRLLYVGGMEESRGLEIVIRAMQIVARTLSARFVIVGRGTTEPALRRLASQLGVADRIDFAGWVAPEEVPRIIGSADICLVPHYVTEHTHTTVPNKIFDYMLQRRPVVVTDALALREIVESAGCGEVYQDTDPASLAAAILRLADPGVRTGMGAAGRQAVLERYNWARDENVLIGAMREFRVLQDEGGSHADASAADPCVSRL